MSISTVKSVHVLLHPVFDMGIRDGIIRTNPTKGIMAEIKKGSLWDKGTRHALTIEQTSAFLDFVEKHPVYNHWLTLVIGVIKYRQYKGMVLSHPFSYTLFFLLTIICLTK